MIDLSSETGKKIGILGLSRTGEHAYAALASYAQVICWDDGRGTRDIFQQIYTNAKLVAVTDSLWQELDYIVISPGIPTTLPKPHPIVAIAKEHNIPLVIDIDLLYKARPNSYYIAITGTNGKSTSTALTEHLLMDHGFVMGGNIGIAVLTLPNDAKGYVLELSSYQLELMRELKPDIAILLNITPDHLERHGTMANYIAAKRRIFNRLTSQSTAIINIDNPYTLEIYHDLLEQSSCKLIAISTVNKVMGGVSVLDAIYDMLEGEEIVIPLPKGNALLGRHNKENMAVSYAAARIYGCLPEEIAQKLESFQALPHRMQYLGQKNNCDFYNDSKATNGESTAVALAALKNIFWLAGGVAKADGLKPIRGLEQNITKAYLFGAAKERFAKELEGWCQYIICNDLVEAFAIAVSDATAKGGGNILLSPACASFDQFKDFEERGRCFLELYERLSFTDN